MRRRTSLTVFLLIGFLISAEPVRAQLPAPNAAGVSAGHMHMMVRDPAAHKKIWVDLFGAQVVNSGSLELLKLPGIFLILGQGRARRGFGRIHARPFRVSGQGPCGHECEAQGRRNSAHAR